MGNLCCVKAHENNNADIYKVNEPEVKIDGKLSALTINVIPGESVCSFTLETCKTSEVLKISVKDLYRFRQSWKGIRRKMDDTGVEMFVSLFKTNKDMLSLFTKFASLTTEDEFRNNEALEQHGVQVMMMIDDAITHIDDYDYVTETLRKTGASHRRFEGFVSANFLKIKDPFLHAVRVTLEDRYTENMEFIYKIAITFILQTLADGYEEATTMDSSSST